MPTDYGFKDAKTNADVPLDEVEAEFRKELGIKKPESEYAIDEWTILPWAGIAAWTRENTIDQDKLTKNTKNRPELLRVLKLFLVERYRFWMCRYH
jgi:hypothetical protein